MTENAYGPTPAAVDHAEERYRFFLENEDMHSEDARQMAYSALYDPALGLDRSVCLRDVVEAVRDAADLEVTARSYIAAWIVREFGMADAR